MEEYSLTESRLWTAKLGTSVLAGSTRWMAPELILTIVEDDGMTPLITTASDVYSFACVCLEVCICRVCWLHFDIVFLIGSLARWLLASYHTPTVGTTVL